MAASFVNVFLSTPTSIQLMDLRSNSKIYYLPAASTVPGAYILAKDYYGRLSTNLCAFSTIGVDTIESVLTTYTFSNRYGSVEFVNDSIKNWTILSVYDGAQSRALNR